MSYKQNKNWLKHLQMQVSEIYFTMSVPDDSSD